MSNNIVLSQRQAPYFHLLVKPTGARCNLACEYCFYLSKERLNHLCKGYKVFFRHIDRPMRIMAKLIQEHRAPAEIIQMLPRRVKGGEGNDKGNFNLY
ncbi:MAG: hypothetical protein ACFFDJ_05690 [Candidatus Odinarchaeota archaeon]